MIKVTQDSGLFGGWLDLIVFMWLLSALIAPVVAPRGRGLEFFGITLLILGPLGVGFAAVAQPRDHVPRGRVAGVCPRCAARQFIEGSDNEFVCWRCDQYCVVRKGMFGARRVEAGTDYSFPPPPAPTQMPAAAPGFAPSNARAPAPAPHGRPPDPVPHPLPQPAPPQAAPPPYALAASAPAGAGALPARAPSAWPEDRPYPTQGKKFWQQVGIDPVQITLERETLYTLRCYLDRHPFFLGRKGLVYVFSSTEALNEYLAGAARHDLSDLETFDSIRLASARGTVRYLIEPENDYILTGLSEAIEKGPDAVDARQLNLAIELLADVAAYGNDLTLTRALAPDRALGRFVAMIVAAEHPTGTPDLPQLEGGQPEADQYAEAAKEWQALESFLKSKLRRK